MTDTLEKIKSVTESWINESIELRYGNAGDELGPLRNLTEEDTVADIMHELGRVRQRADRISFLRTQAFILRGKLRRNKAQKAFEAEAKFEESMSSRERAKREYQSALSVKSEASLDSFQEKREAHEANMVLDIVDDAYNLIHTLNMQLDVIRNDYRAIIKGLQFQSTLDH